MKTTTKTKSRIGSPVMSKTLPDKTFFRIGEVARLLGVKAHVLRYWETEFPLAAPRKSSSNQRVYRRGEVLTLFEIKKLLYEEKYSIAGARKRLGARKPEKIERLEALTRELGLLVRTPISRLFHL